MRGMRGGMWNMFKSVDGSWMPCINRSPTCVLTEVQDAEETEFWMSHKVENEKCVFSRWPDENLHGSATALKPAAYYCSTACQPNSSEQSGLGESVLCYLAPWVYDRWFDDIKVGGYGSQSNLRECHDAKFPRTLPCLKMIFVIYFTRCHRI